MGAGAIRFRMVRKSGRAQARSWGDTARMGVVNLLWSRAGALLQGTVPL
ncbi:hypothetical protein GCM10009552_06940 [Rothia nasimurium]